MHCRKKSRKIVCISLFICLTYNSMFCHISFTFEISYISTICSLSSNYCTFSFKVASISISSKTISSINRILPCRKNFSSLDAFTRTKPRANFAKRICSKLHTYTSHPIFFNCNLISSSCFLLSSNSCFNSPVRFVIFSSKGTPSPSSSAIPTYLPGVRMKS